MVLLPPPDGPTSAIVSPSGIAKLTFLTAGASAPGYVKDTPSKTISHVPLALQPFAEQQGISGVDRIPSIRITASWAIAAASEAYSILVIIDVVTALNTT